MKRYRIRQWNPATQEMTRLWREYICVADATLGVIRLTNRYPDLDFRWEGF